MEAPQTNCVPSITINNEPRAEGNSMESQVIGVEEAGKVVGLGRAAAYRAAEARRTPDDSVRPQAQGPRARAAGAARRSAREMTARMRHRAVRFIYVLAQEVGARALGQYAAPFAISNEWGSSVGTARPTRCRSARPGRQGRELLEELERREDEMRRAIGPRTLEVQRDSPVGQTLLSERGAQEISAQMFQPAAVVTGHAHARVEVETLDMRLTWS
jgi:hypothetical protein